ncbi:hypothetical protein NHQ30_010095 [Ciborinia camelliae]|nr:hypothetical protein NHQ30_010095 [Ciborinia camelliae]
MLFNATYTIYIYRAACTSTSARARQIRNSRLSHHYMNSPSNDSPNTPHPFSRLETPPSPRSVFSLQNRPISLPVLQHRPEIGGSYRTRETYERNVPMQSQYKYGEKRMEFHGHSEEIEMDRSEEDDGRRTDFSPAFV